MKTILVVDDSKTARLTLKRKLDLLNYQVEMADSGESAIELLKQSAPPDLIFLDVLMGNMSGYEAAAEILKNPIMADVPIVMCTSKDSQEDRDEAARNGAKGFIIKPITDEALEQVLRELVLERVRAPAAAAAVAAQPVPTPVPEVAAEAPQAQFVISAELETLVRQMVEQANLQRAEEAASQVVHAALSEHLHQVEDILEGKISILTSSLAALHSAQDQAQAEFQNALTKLSKADSSVDEQHITNLISAQLKDFEADEHSKRAIHELDVQTRLEQNLRGLADQAAQAAAERVTNQALGSHFAMMEDKLQKMGADLATLKSESMKESAPSISFDELAFMARVETHLAERMNALLPQMVSAHANEQFAAHISASDAKFQSIKQDLSAGIQAVSDALAAQKTQTTPPPAVPKELPGEWMQELLAQQDAMLEQRFNAWSAQMDTHLAETERTLFERIDEKTEAALALLQTPLVSPAKPQQDTGSGNKLALGLAALGVVLALVALIL